MNGTSDRTLSELHFVMEDAIANDLNSFMIIGKIIGTNIVAATDSNENIEFAAGEEVSKEGMNGLGVF